MSQGDLIVDEHQLVSCIASGNSSQVWEVVSKADNQRYAMKLLLPESLADPEQVKVLKHEAKVGQSLNHANIIKVFKSSVSRDFGYILMEYFRAPNLKAQIGTDHLGLQIRIRKLIEGLLLSVGYMHEQGWLHKDIKPENVLFSKSSELRLIDFSLSGKFAQGIGKFFAGKLKIIQGTRTYIAPETIKKEQPTQQTDMYSLGVTLYEVLTGQPPYKGSTPQDLLKKHLGAPAPHPSHTNANVTPEMDRFVLKMLSKKPKDRHKSMDEAYAEFRTIKVFKEDVQELADKMAKDFAEKNAETFDGRRNKLSSRNDAERVEKPADAPKAETAAPTKPQPTAAPSPATARAGQGGGPAPTMPAGAGRPAQPGVQQPAMQQPGMQQPGAPQPMPAGRPGYPPGYPMPAGMQQPAMQQPGMPPGYYPPGYGPQHPGQPMPGQPPQGQPPQGWPGQGQFPPGNYPPGSLSPGQYPPGQFPQGQYPAGQFPAGQRPPAPGQIPPQLAQRPGMPGQQVAQPVAQPAGAAASRPAAPPAARQPAPTAPAKKPTAPPTATQDDDLPEMDELPPIV